ncbi:hypothetical protein EDB80DRAFT_218101 [Ilyonectria destructans]|nr:hypothetical protein EDB80DRAFT_218101 [Ilyonectria destructans]
MAKGELHSCDPIAQRQGRLLPQREHISGRDATQWKRQCLCARRATSGMQTSKWSPPLTADCFVQQQDDAILSSSLRHHARRRRQSDSPGRGPSPARGRPWRRRILSRNAVLRPSAGVGFCRYCGNPCASAATRNAEYGREPLGRHGAAGAQPASHGVAVARPSARGITSLLRSRCGCARARPQSDNECQLLQGPQSSTLTTRQDRAALLSLQAVVHAH